MPETIPDWAAGAEAVDIPDWATEASDSTVPEWAAGETLTPESLADYLKGQPKFYQPNWVNEITTDLTAAVVNDPSQLPALAMGAITAPGRLAYEAAADVVSAVAGQPEYGGNLAAGMRGQTPPVEKFLGDVSQTNPNLAVAGKLGKSLTEMAPLGVVGMLPGWAAKLAAVGFSADMIRHAPEQFAAYAEEINKPEAEQDADKLSTLKSDIIQTFAFAPAAGAHGVGKAAGKVASDISIGLDNARRLTSEVERGSATRSGNDSTAAPPLAVEARPIADEPAAARRAAPLTEPPEWALEYAGGEMPRTPAVGGEVAAAKTPKPKTQTPTSEVNTTTAIDPSMVFTVEFPLEKLKLSKDVPNFKGGASEETGTVAGQELTGKYERRGTAPIVAWERLNGDVEVITGRHRFDLAKRTGEKTIPTQIVREADGFTKEQALTFDAEANIRDGQGEVTDYATYFKGTNISEGEARSRGLLSRTKGKAGWSLAKAATDDVYALWRDGKINDSQAVAIANSAPGDAGAQRIGSKFALQGKSPDFIANVIKASLAEAGTRAQSLDLFGNDDAAMNTMAEQATRASQFQKEISEQIRAVQGAAKRPEVARKLGVDVKDPEAITAKIGELKGELARWENWPLQPDLVAKVRGEPPPVAEVPKLRAGEKGTGDLLQGADAPFNLAGERGLDVERIAKAKADAAATAQAAKEFEAKNQPDIFGGTSGVGFPAASAPVPPTPSPAPAPGVTMIQHGRLPVTLDRTVAGSVSVPQIMDSMQRVLRAAGSQAGNLRTGRFLNKALGIWKPHEEIIRMESADSIPTATHEVGHGLQQLIYGTFKAGGLKFLSPAIRRELIGMGRALYGSRKPVAGYTGEGFAEFARYWLTTDDAAKVAPQMTKFFETQFLPKHPEVAKSLAEARSLVDIWRAQGSVERAQRQLVKEPGAWRKVAEALAKVVGYQSQFESGAPIEAVSKAAARKLGRPLRPSEDPYSLYSAKRGTAGATVERMATEHMLDVWGNPVGPSLAEALAPIKGRRKEFLLYVFAQAAEMRWKQNKNPGISLEDARHIKGLYDSPEFRLAADKYRKWNDQLLDYAVQADPSMADAVAAMRGANDFYAPLARMIDPAKAKAAAANAQSNSFQRMFGSGLPVKDIFDQTFINAARLVNRANRALVARSLIKLSNIQGLGHIVEEVPRDRVAERFNVEQIRKQLESMGVDTSMIPKDEILQYYSLADKPKGSDPIVSVKDSSGQTRWYQVDPRLYDTLEGLQTFSLKQSFPGIPYLGQVLDLLLGTPSRAFRLGTTGLRPAFSLVTNPARDVATLLAQTSSNPAKVAAMYPAAMKEAIRGGPYKSAFYDLGAHLGQPLGTDIGHTQRVSKELFHGRIMRVVRNPVDHFRELLSITESAPRIAELRAVADDIGWKPGTPLSPDQAVQLTLAAKRVTVDFSAAGDVSRVLNQAIPFYNPALQGLRSFARAFKNDPAKASLMGLALFTAPALALWWQNKDKEWYQALPWRERYLYTHIDDGTNVWRIPRPFEWGNVFMVMPEAILDSFYRHDPEAAKQALAHTFESTNPADLPVLAKLAKEQWQNKIDFWDRPIVPRSEVDLPAAEQFGPYTSRLALAINKAFPEVSPRRVDAAVRGYFGGAGTDLMDLVGIGSQRRDRDWEASDFPVFGALFRRGGEFNAQNQHINDFWDAYLPSRARVAGFNNARSQAEKGLRDPATIKPPSLGDLTAAQEGSKASPAIQALLTMAARTKDTKARAELYRQAGEMARGATTVIRNAQKTDEQK